MWLNHVCHFVFRHKTQWAKMLQCAWPTYITDKRNCHTTLMSTALGRPPFLIHGWTSISSFFCSSEKRGWFFCRSLSFSLSSLSTLWMSLQTQHIHVEKLKPHGLWVEHINLRSVFTTVRFLLCLLSSSKFVAPNIRVIKCTFPISDRGQ